MIANFFNKSAPATTLSIFIITSLVVLVSIFTTTAADFNFIFFIKKIAVLLLLMLTLFLIQFITKKNGLIKDNAYDLLLVVLFMTMFPKSIEKTNFILLHFILLLAFRRLYSLRTIKTPKEKLFDSSFYIGIATLIYPWSIFYLALPYVAIANFNKRTIRNVIIPLVGFATPFIIYVSYLLLIDKFTTFELDFNYNFIFTEYNALNLLAPIALLLGFLIWVIIPTTIRIVSFNTDLKNTWYLLLAHLIISILVIIPAPIKDGSEFIFLFFPSAIIFTNYLQVVKEKWFKEVFLYLFSLIAIITYFL
ncbi:hypothetical protein EGM88_08740 [Aureibaculum marinum]|uniref:Beta-carotene 15,15'-monooxygenase n=1 Tax=Aureibaculum marinum TaxID=2487930 RepID=A0A3N4NTT6_9FLAO|nr:DUF6427 family protein [Aureibaculum marinum]RPD96446.1 hypothetical protein EGM88_08740 [Aureibaculum marinum]